MSTLIKHIYEFLRHRSGVVAVEMALIMSAFLFVMLGLLEFGFLVKTRTEVANAARSGAQFALIDLTEDGIKTAADLDSTGVETAVKESTLGLLDGKITVNSSVFCSCRTGEVTDISDCDNDSDNDGIDDCADMAYLVKVEVSYAYNPLFDYPGLPDTFTVTKTSTLRYQ